MKDASEGSGNQPVPLYTAAPGTSIGSLAVSPSGLQMLFTLLSGQTKADFRSQIEAIGTVDGSNGGVAQITDGKALDVQPTYTPAGDQIVFASNRAGKRLNIWRKALQGGPGIEQLTNNDEQDLWPMIDATPKARLFYQALSDSQNEAQLYVAPVDGGPRMDVATTSIQQPRVSPKADAILFTSVNQRTGNREIYRIPDKGGPATNLTIDPDNDYYDPAWSHDGTKIAFVSNRGLDEDRNHNADIWIMDLAHANPIQVTSNGSVDDCPVWDPAGNAIYFRSNRGGQWGIWRISLQ
jgi:Tol biopolymer transport system component